MKALELLKQYQYADNCLDGLMAEELNEAITELEELENRSCESCKHYVQINKSDLFVCSLLLDCIRKYKPKDRFEIKDKQ